MSKREHQGSESDEKRRKIPNWLGHLRAHGYATIPCVLSEDKVKDYKTSFWDWMESFGSGIDRNNSTTWKTENWPQSIRGLIQHYRVGHAKFVWDIRTEKEVLEVFSTIWETEDLLVSFDGACLAKPSHIETTPETDSWAHLDQGPKKAGRFECVQGLMTFSEAGPDLGGLVVYKNSHALHKKFFKRFPKVEKKVGSSDWCKLEPKHRKWYFRHGAVEIQPTAPPGSIILWDSRTVHWAARPAKSMDHCRMAVYLCYVPRNRAAKKDIEKKRTAFDERRMTSHWPAQPKLFPKQPRTYGNVEILEKFTDRPVITKADETPQIRKLAGY